MVLTPRTDAPQPPNLPPYYVAPSNSPRPLIMAIRRPPIHDAAPQPRTVLWNLQVVGFLLLFVSLPLTLVARAQTRNSGPFRGAGLVDRVVATGPEDRISHPRPGSQARRIFRTVPDCRIRRAHRVRARHSPERECDAP